MPRRGMTPGVQRLELFRNPRREFFVGVECRQAHRDRHHAISARDIDPRVCCAAYIALLLPDLERRIRAPVRVKRIADGEIHLFESVFKTGCALHGHLLDLSSASAAEPRDCLANLTFTKTPEIDPHLFLMVGSDFYCSARRFPQSDASG
jgi:hypothetical protein